MTHPPRLDSDVLCVSVHDVAPATWPLCERLVEAVSAVAPVPLTFLVVPDFHGMGASLPGWYRDALAEHVEAGDELALHGYFHVDDGPPPRAPLQWWRRRVMTDSEGEFSALDVQTARQRLQAGLDWFRREGWRPQGFVAPAWQLGERAWEALDEFPFDYTTTADAFHLLHPRRTVRTRCFAYSTRSNLRQAVSLSWNRARGSGGRGIARLALHPDDARHPAVIAQVQRLLESLLRERVPLTKASLAAGLAAELAARQAGSATKDASAMLPPSAPPARTSLG